MSTRNPNFRQGQGRRPLGRQQPSPSSRREGGASPEGQDRTVSRRRRRWMPPFRMVARRPGTGRGETDDGYCGGSEDECLRHLRWRSDPSRRKPGWRRTRRALGDAWQWVLRKERSAHWKEEPTVRGSEGCGAEVGGPSLDRVECRRSGREVMIGGSSPDIRRGRFPAADQGGREWDRCEYCR